MTVHAPVALPAVATVPDAPEFTYEEVIEPAPSLEQQLHDSIVQVEERKAKPYDKFAMFEAMEFIKKRFLAIKKEDTYREVLGRYGAKKRTDLSTTDGGRQARDCYKEMTLVVADLEAAEALRREAAASLVTEVPAEDLIF